MDTKRIGNIAELKIITRLIELGYHVSLPYGDNSRYDLIADKDDKLIRIQCKSARYQDGGLHAHANSRNHYNTKGYKNEIEFFALYSPDLDKIYLVPIDKVKTSDIWLRVDPLINKIKTETNWAKDYEI